jgi:hypothetical protein
LRFSSFAFSFHTGDNGDIAVNAGLVIPAPINGLFDIDVDIPVPGLLSSGLSVSVPLSESIGGITGSGSSGFSGRVVMSVEGSTGFSGCLPF